MNAHQAKSLTLLIESAVSSMAAEQLNSLIAAPYLEMREETAAAYSAAA